MGKDNEQEQWKLAEPFESLKKAREFIQLNKIKKYDVIILWDEYYDTED